MNEECGTCKFWKLDEGTLGWCHRYPPNQKDSCFPIVYSNDWCGEHKPAKEGL